MFWEILKIEPTTDRKKIIAAYRQLLAVTNPEDDPEAFKELRKAYEDALAYAQTHAENIVRTPVEVWEMDLQELYDDFGRRIKVSEWQKLLNEEVCQSVDTRMRSEEILLKFLMDHYFLPHDVFVYLDSQFSWLDRMEELYQSYPQEFLDFVIANGIHFPDVLPLDMFIPGRDGDACHAYTDIYLKILRTPSEERKPLYEELMNSSEQHPFGTGMYLNWKYFFEHDEEAYEKLCKLQKEYPENVRIALMVTEIMLERGEYDACLELSKEMQKYTDDVYSLRWYEAEALAGKNMYPEAVKVLERLMKDAGADNQRKYELDQKRFSYNEHIIADLEKKMEAGEADDETRMELAWAYLENNLIDKSEEAASQVADDYPDRFNYHNLFSNIDVSKNRLEEAIVHLRKLLEVTKDIPEDTEQNIVRRSRLGEIHMRLAYTLYIAGHRQEAMEVYQQAMEVAKDKSEVLSHLMHIAYDEHEFEKAAGYAKQMIELSPGNYQGFLTLAYAYFSMYQDREAYNAVEKALDLCRSDLSVYVLKARILIRNNAEGGAQEIVDFLERSGLEEDPSVKYLHGLIEEDCHTSPEAAGQLYDEALKTIEEEQRREEYTADLVYRLLCIRAEGLNANEEKDRNYMLELCDKGLKADPEYYGLLDYKAWLLVRAKEYEEALKIYMHLLDNPYHGPAVEAQIGYIYYQDLEHKADLSLKYYEKSLANEGAPSGHFYAGMCCMYMNRLDEAEEHFLKLRESNPDSLDASFRLSFVYAMKNDLPKALECAKKATAIVNAQGNRPVQYYLREVTLLRRMRRVDEAAEILEHIRDKYGYKYADKLIFRTYCQAGRFDDAKAHLKTWAKKDPNDPDLSDCGILLHMYRRNFNAASLEYRMVKKHLDADRALEIDQILSEYYGDFRKQYKELQQWLEYRKKNDGFDICRILGAVAMNCFRIGDQESAEYYANKALQEIDEKLEEFETDKLLFMARKLRLLAILGKKEEERELLKECGKMPLCQSCPERTCKDVDIFKMEAEEVFGNYTEAYIMALEGQKQYPDEEDFLIAERLLKKKAG